MAKLLRIQLQTIQPVNVFAVTKSLCQDTQISKEQYQHKDFCDSLLAAMQIPTLHVLDHIMSKNMSEVVPTCLDSAWLLQAKKHTPHCLRCWQTSWHPHLHYIKQACNSQSHLMRVKSTLLCQQTATDHWRASAVAVFALLVTPAM